MKKIIFLGMLYLPLVALSQSVQPQDSTLGFLIIGLPSTNWEKIPANVKTQSKQSVGFYGEVMNEGYLITNNPHWCLALGVIAEYDVIGSNAWISKDASGKNTLVPIPSGTSYSQNNLSIYSEGIPIEIHYNVYLGKKGNTKLFIAAGYIIEYTGTVQTSYTAKGDSATVVTYTNDKNINPFRQQLTAKAGFGYHTKNRHWLYLSVDGFYGLNSIYKSNEGPYLVPYSIGISLGANLWN